MKITLHLAISADGFIAKPDGDSDWVDDADETRFIQRAREAGCLVIGRKTFEQYRGTMYPVDGIVNIVLTKNPHPGILDACFANSPAAAIELAEEKGHDTILIAGGGHVSISFLEADLIDEIFFSVHPLILGQGIKPFAEKSIEKKLQLLDSKQLNNGLVELHYKILRDV